MKASKNKIYELAKLCFGLVNEIRRHNKDEIFVDESFDSIEPHRQNYLYDNIQAVINNPDITAKDMHEEWAKVRINDGWTYSPVTDRAKKKHDCLVSYDELNIYQKLKDHLVVETIKMYLGVIKEDTITITRNEYDCLIESEKQLTHLECNGVNNWSEYSYYTSDDEDDF